MEKYYKIGNAYIEIISDKEAMKKYGNSEVRALTTINGKDIHKELISPVIVHGGLM